MKRRIMVVIGMVEAGTYAKGASYSDLQSALNKNMTDIANAADFNSRLQISSAIKVTLEAMKSTKEYKKDGNTTRAVDNLFAAFAQLHNMIYNTSQAGFFSKKGDPGPSYELGQLVQFCKEVNPGYATDMFAAAKNQLAYSKAEALKEKQASTYIKAYDAMISTAQVLEIAYALHYHTLAANSKKTEKESTDYIRDNKLGELADNLALQLNEGEKALMKAYRADADDASFSKLLNAISSRKGPVQPAGPKTTEAPAEKLVKKAKELVQWILYEMDKKNQSGRDATANITYNSGQLAATLGELAKLDKKNAKKLEDAQSAAAYVYGELSKNKKLDDAGWNSFSKVLGDLEKTLGKVSKAGTGAASARKEEATNVNVTAPWLLEFTDAVGKALNFNEANWSVWNQVRHIKVGLNDAVGLKDAAVLGIITEDQMKAILSGKEKVALDEDDDRNVAKWALVKALIYGRIRDGPNGKSTAVRDQLDQGLKAGEAYDLEDGIRQLYDEETGTSAVAEEIASDSNLSARGKKFVEGLVRNLVLGKDFFDKVDVRNLGEPGAAEAGEEEAEEAVEAAGLQETYPNADEFLQDHRANVLLRSVFSDPKLREHSNDAAFVDKLVSENCLGANGKFNNDGKFHIEGLVQFASQNAHERFDKPEQIQDQNYQRVERIVGALQGRSTVEVLKELGYIGEDGNFTKDIPGGIRDRKDANQYLLLARLVDTLRVMKKDKSSPSALQQLQATPEKIASIYEPLSERQIKKVLEVAANASAKTAAAPAPGAPKFLSFEDVIAYYPDDVYKAFADKVKNLDAAGQRGLMESLAAVKKFDKGTVLAAINGYAQAEEFVGPPTPTRQKVAQQSETDQPDVKVTVRQNTSEIETKVGWVDNIFKDNATYDQLTSKLKGFKVEDPAGTATRFQLELSNDPTQQNTLNKVASDHQTVDYLAGFIAGWSAQAQAR